MLLKDEEFFRVISSRFSWLRQRVCSILFRECCLFDRFEDSCWGEMIEEKRATLTRVKRLLPFGGRMAEAPPSSCRTNHLLLQTKCSVDAYRESDMNKRKQSLNFSSDSCLQETEEEETAKERGMLTSKKKRGAGKSWRCVSEVGGHGWKSMPWWGEGLAKREMCSTLLLSPLSHSIPSILVAWAEISFSRPIPVDNICVCSSHLLFPVRLLSFVL